MLLVNSYYNKHGLINAYKHEQVSENCSLFTLERLLMPMLSYNKKNLKIDLRNYWQKCLISRGLYNQLPPDTVFANAHDRYMSPDQFVALICFCKIEGYEEELKNIWKEVKRQKFRYDNVNPGRPSWKRIMRPQEIILCGYLAGGRFCNLLLPVFSLLCFSSMVLRPNHTSGKCLVYVKCKAANLHKTFHISTWLLRFTKFRNWGAVFQEYFHGRPDHPVYLASESLE